MLSTMRKRPATSHPSHHGSSSGNGSSLTLEDVYGAKLKAARLPSRSSESDTFAAGGTSIPVGPSDIGELFAWPKWMMERMLDPSVPGSAGRRHRLAENLGAGIVLHSDHSGLGTAEMAMHSIAEEAHSRGLVRQGTVHCHRACDIKPCCQRILLNSGAQGAEHIHVDVLDAIRPELSNRLEAMRPEASWSRSKKLASYKASYQVMLEAYNNRTLFKDDGGSDCLAHDKECPVFHTPTDGSRPLRGVISGTSCTAWSASGKQEGSAHHTVLPWFAFVFYILTFRPDFAIHEITELHPDEIMEFHFSEFFDMVSLHLSPFQFGFPCRRPRRYRILTNKATVGMVAGKDDILGLLQCKVNIPTEDVLCAEPGMVKEAFDRLARLRRKIPKSGEEMAWERLLTPAQLGRLTAHRRSVGGTSLEGKFFADIAKVEQVRRPSASTPTLVQNSLIWSEALGREAVVMEHFTMQGFPALPAVSGYSSVPWEATLGCPPEGFSESELRSMTGNAMHLAVVGAVCLFALCSMERLLDGPMRFRHMHYLLELPDDDGAVDGDGDDDIE